MSTVTNAARSRDDCAPALMSVDEALAGLLERARIVSGIEQIPLAESGGRVLALDVLATTDMPPFANSAVDGYAVNANDIAAGNTRLPISCRICAGDDPGELSLHTAARIFTGAALPAGADTVIMQEDCTNTGNEVLLPQGIRPGANVRERGEDFRRGQCLLTRGSRLLPTQLGLLAAAGIARVPVYRRLRVALLSTGNELHEPGVPLAPGGIYNANYFSLTSLLQRLGCELIDGGTVRDDAAQLQARLQALAGQCDLIISTGSVSVGEEDHIQDAMRALGQVALWQVAIKPGKPFLQGMIGATPMLGLPGNPVSVLVTFSILARPFILRMQGVTDTGVHSMSLPASFSRPAGSRREYARARVSRNTAGQAVLELHPQQGSAILNAAAWAQGYAVLRENVAVQSGDPVEFISYAELL